VPQEYGAASSDVCAPHWHSRVGQRSRMCSVQLSNPGEMWLTCTKGLWSAKSITSYSALVGGVDAFRRGESEDSC
jgi:hypothetical protein